MAKLLLNAVMREYGAEDDGITETVDGEEITVESPEPCTEFRELFPEFIPPSAKKDRRQRDDMTVTVIFFR